MVSRSRVRLYFVKGECKKVTSVVLGLLELGVPKNNLSFRLRKCKCSTELSP